MWQAILAIFQAITGVSKAVEKGLPSEKIQEDNHLIARERLTLKEKDRIIESSRLYLSLHPKIDIDTYCDFKFDDLSLDDIAEIRLLLHEMFPKREKRTFIYKPNQEI